MDFESEKKKTQDKIKLLENSGKKMLEELKQIQNKLNLTSSELIKQKVKLEVLKDLCEQKAV